MTGKPKPLRGTSSGRGLSPEDQLLWAHVTGQSKPLSNRVKSLPLRPACNESTLRRERIPEYLRIRLSPPRSQVPVPRLVPVVPDSTS